MNDTLLPLTQDRLSWCPRLRQSRWGQVEDSGEARASGMGQAPNWSRRKGLGQSSPTPQPPPATVLRPLLWLIPPSSLLCSVFPGSPSEAQVTEHPLAEGINTLN